MRGTIEADVRYNERNQWQIIAFELSSFDSMVADRDLFSEVSVPAGTSITKPAFGAPGWSTEIKVRKSVKQTC